MSDNYVQELHDEVAALKEEIRMLRHRIDWDYDAGCDCRACEGYKEYLDSYEPKEPAGDERELYPGYEQEGVQG